MKQELTAKQEKFCMAYLEADNASDAYRECYNTEKMNANTVNRAAFELLENPKIIARLAAIRKPVIEKVQLSIQDIIDELEQARTIALAAETPQASAATAASMGKAKLLGYLIDKKEVRTGALDESNYEDLIRIRDAVANARLDDESQTSQPH